MLYLLNICQVNRKVFKKKGWIVYSYFYIHYLNVKVKTALIARLRKWFLGWQVHAILAKIELQEYQDLHVMDTIEWPTCITVAGFFSSWLWDIKHLLKTKKSSFRIINLIFSASVTRVWFPLVRFIPEIYPLQQWQITLYSVSVCAGR